MKTDRGNFPAFPGLDRAAAGFLERITEYGPKNLWELSSPDLGHPVKTARSSWVRSHILGSKTYYVKTYDYPSLRARARGWLRNTAFAASRAEQEYRALQWLISHGFPTAQPAAVWSDRSPSGIRRACLVSEHWEGQPVDQLLPRLDPERGRALLSDLRAQVEALHRCGFRDRNMDLRNWLARPGPGPRWLLAKIDSPRYRLVPAGQPKDALAEADWARLRSSLARCGPMDALQETRLVRPPD